MAHTSAKRLAGELVQGRLRRAEARLRLVVQVDGHEAVRARRGHEMQEQLGRDGLAGLELPVLPRVLHAGQHLTAVALKIFKALKALRNALEKTLEYDYKSCV